MSEEFGKWSPTEDQVLPEVHYEQPTSLSTVEFRNVEKDPIYFDENEVCDACNFAEKKQIDWAAREQHLRELWDRFRRNDGRYDVVVPGSGGKDSVMAAHLLKYKYGMNRSRSWPPAIYNGIGRYNFDRWLEAVANHLYQNRRVHRILTQQAFVNLCHPFSLIPGRRTWHRDVGPARHPAGDLWRE